MGSDRGSRLVLGGIFGVAAVLLGAGLLSPRHAPAPRLVLEMPTPAPSATAPARAAASPPRAASPTPRPGRPLTTAEFLAEPGLLESHPTDVGHCRLVEHWNTGYCYVWSQAYGRKISQTTDARCDDLPELRRRMRAAIERGDCN